MERVEKIPGSAAEACNNTLLASWWERLCVWAFGTTLVSEDEHCTAIARRYRGKIYMVHTRFKTPFRQEGA